MMNEEKQLKNHIIGLFTIFRYEKTALMTIELFCLFASISAVQRQEKRKQKINESNDHCRCSYRKLHWTVWTSTTRAAGTPQGKMLCVQVLVTLLSLSPMNIRNSRFSRFECCVPPGDDITGICPFPQHRRSMKRKTQSNAVPLPTCSLPFAPNAPRIHLFDRHCLLGTIHHNLLPHCWPFCSFRPADQVCHGSNVRLPRGLASDHWCGL